MFKPRKIRRLSKYPRKKLKANILYRNQWDFRFMQFLEMLAEKVSWHSEVHIPVGGRKSWHQQGISLQ